MDYFSGDMLTICFHFMVKSHFLCSVEFIPVHTRHEGEQNWVSNEFSQSFYYGMRVAPTGPSCSSEQEWQDCKNLAVLFHGAHRGYGVVETSKTSTNHVCSPVSSVWIKTHSKISEIKVSRQAKEQSRQRRGPKMCEAFMISPFYTLKKRKGSLLASMKNL